MTYGPESVEVLMTCWAVLDGPTGKRLHAALPEVVANLSVHGHLGDIDPSVIEEVLAMSPATIDRKLSPARTGLVARKPISHTRPGTMLKSSIPMKTWHEWNDTIPGFIQIDLVGHEGGDNNGEFHFTLDAVDVATGWTEAITVHSKGERIVAAGLEQLVLRFPFAILGIHSDNGSEFINHHLARWCNRHQITFTRGRASHSNDQAHVEQKNWSVVRRSVGYFRYDTKHELELLNQLWPLVSTQVNLFLPQQRLLSKTRTGARVKKTYDIATTPAARIQRDHPDLLDPADQKLIDTRLTETDLITLKTQITLIQANLTELARRRGPVKRRGKTQTTFNNRQKIAPTKRAKPDESTNHTSRAS
ncbi:MAG: DDE-type integrase/transposase/recombinase [Nocardioidaceae bacterium]